MSSACPQHFVVTPLRGLNMVDLVSRHLWTDAATTSLPDGELSVGRDGPILLWVSGMSSSGLALSSVTECNFNLPAPVRARS